MSDFEDVRDADGKLPFRIDRERELIEIQRRGQKMLVDLKPVPNNILDKIGHDSVS